MSLLIKAKNIAICLLNTVIVDVGIIKCPLNADHIYILNLETCSSTYVNFVTLDSLSNISISKFLYLVIFKMLSMHVFNKSILSFVGIRMDTNGSSIGIV